VSVQHLANTPCQIRQNCQKGTRDAQGGVLSVLARLSGCRHGQWYDGATEHPVQFGNADGRLAETSLNETTELPIRCTV
jgi:hypothetical protein